MRKANVKEAINGYSDDTYITPYTLKMFMLNKIYPINSVYVSANKDNPKSYLGGEWELIDKEFISSNLSNSSIFSPSSNIQDVVVHVVRAGHSFSVRLGFENTVALGDGATLLGTLDFSKLGVSRLFAGVQYIYAGSDAGNGYALCSLNWSTGELQSIDVNCKGGATSIAANNQFYLQFWIDSSVDYMLNDACDRFYWKRIK